MRFVIMSLIGIAVVASPCVYDSDPREPSAVVAMIASMSSPSSLELAAVNVHSANHVSTTAP
ncbi:hypothetical protein CU102_13955 [Phyllobacterium brassicacearum]|uniref:Uncharacterized protein n=1 Tax=Phyllobacterium brassicacearum TaxID=314235 RepID=A0A2P7BPM4_9HYPH|nr:hypothetical protein [Phyllobacterium brassicacearum]PSH68390.1 hypothetical protein CU102_13955 [Phyllobacterium brassicacearum]TDQ31735.1 hypothetical protein DEV91_10772 [Phyllobacterium brassicacearum]